MGDKLKAMKGQETLEAGKEHKLRELKGTRLQMQDITVKRRWDRI